MLDQIILNNKAYQTNKDDLPCLITYTEKTGGSHFSVSMVADLFLQGQKILFLTAYPMAKDNFLKQIQGYEKNTSYISDPKQLNPNTQAIILESGNEDLFLEAIKILPDIKERIILIKNIEVFSQTIFDQCLNYQKIILSGNIDKCSAKIDISNYPFNTIIAFSKPEINLPITLPPLEKYLGYWSGKNKKGLTKIQVNKSSD
jgi:hypothetical protein